MWLKRMVVSVLIAGTLVSVAGAQTPAAPEAPDDKEMSEVLADMERELGQIQQRRREAAANAAATLPDDEPDEPAPAPMTDPVGATSTPVPTTAPVVRTPPAAPTTAPAVPEMTPTSAPAPIPAASADGGIRLQYDNAPIGYVVRSISQKMGRPLMGDYNVSGTITFFDAQPYTMEEAFETVNILLAMRNYRLVVNKRFLQLVPLSDIGSLDIDIYRGMDKTVDLSGQELATVLIPLKYLGADEASKMVVRMVSEMGTISPMARSKGILITDVMSNIRRIHELLQMVDIVDTGDSSTEIIELKDARARDVSTVIDNLWGIKGAPKKMVYDERRKRNVPVAPDPKDFIRTTYDERTNMLVIAGEPGKVALAMEMIERLDRKGGPSGGDIRIFKLANAKAQNLVTTINGMFGLQGVRRGPATAEKSVRVVADAATNRLIVSAPADKMAEIENLIASLDDASVVSSGTRVFRLRSADANQLVPIIVNATRKRDSRGRVSSSLTVSADPRSNTLIVAGDAADIETAATLIEQLDTDTELEAMEIRVIHVESGDVRQLSQSLLRILSANASPATPSRGRRMPSLMPSSGGRIRIEADWTSNNLIIAAPPTEWPRIEKILADLQAATATAKMVTRTIPLKAAKADEMAMTLQRVLMSPGRRNSRQMGLQIQIAPSRQANALVVTASAEDQQRVADLVAQLDSGESVEPITMIELVSADAQKVAMTLQAMIPRAMRGQASVSITADTGANVVLLRGPAAEREVIEKMIARLDAVTGESARETRIHQLTHASAAALTPIVTQMYAPGTSSSMSMAWNRGSRRRMPSLSGGGENRVVISAAPGDKALVIDAPASKMDQIVQLIESLDTDSGQAGQLMPRSYILKSADASQLARSLGRLFAAPRMPGRQMMTATTTAPQPKFEAEQRTNTLLVTATAEQYEQIEPMIEKVDGEMIEQTKIIPLTYAKANDLVDVVRTMLTGQQAPTMGWRRPQMSSTGGSVHVAAMPRTNSLIVQGPPEKLALAEQLVANLDTDDGPSRTIVEIVALTSADATSLAETINASRGGQTTGFRPGRGGFRMPSSDASVVTVTAEPNSNSVLVRGPAGDVPEVVEMIRRLDGNSDPRGPRLQTIRLVNNDAAELADQLGTLFRDMIKQTQSSGGSRRGQRGSQQVPFTISADTRTNSLVVSTTPAYFAMFKELVDQLETAEVENAGQVHHITLVNADAYDLAEQLRTMFRDRRGPDAPIIEGDLWTNSLTIIAKEVDYNKMKPIIEQMDQVAMIQVRVISASSLRADQLAEQLQRVYPQVSNGELEVVEEIPDRKGSQPSGRERESNAIPKGISPADDSHGQLTPPATPEEPARPKVLIAVDKITNSLIVSGTRMELDNIEDLILQLSQGAQSAEAEFRWYKIGQADPASVAATLNSLFNPRTVARQATRRTPQQGNQQQQQQGGRNPRQQLQAPAPKPVITVATDVRTRHVIVRAKPTELDMIDSIIKQLDQVTTVVTEVRTIPLKNTDASEVASNLRELFRLSSSGSSLRRPRPGRQPTMQRAEGVRQMLEMLGPDGERVQVDVSSMVSVTANQATNSIIVSAPADAMVVVEGIIQELDQSAGATTKPVIRLYPVQGDVAALAETLQTIFTQSTQRGRGPRRVSRSVPESPVVITPDAAGKVLIVSASADRHELIKGVLEDVQAAHSQTGEAVIRVYKISVADARQVATAIETTFGGASGSSGMRRGTRSAATGSGTLKVTADTSSNSVVVSTTADQHEKIDAMVTEMDTPPGGQSLVRSITMKQADAAAVANVLTRVFVPSGSGRGGAPKSIVIEGSSESGTILVRADDEMFTRIEAMAQQMDGAGQSSQVFLMPLTRAKAGPMATRVADLHTQQVQAAKAARQTPPAPLAVTADERANALVLACTPEQFEQVSQWVNQLEELSRGGRGNPRIIPLKDADPAEVEQAIRQLFGGSAPARGGASNDTLPFDLTVLTKQRQLLIDASDEDFETIRQLVATLEAAGAATRPEFQLFELKYADNIRVAQALTQMFNRMRQPGRPEDNVTVTALPQTTAVVVAGTAERIADAARLIEQLDTAAVSPEVQFRIFPLEHAQPSKVITLLDKMLGEYRKANPNQPIGLTADEATRSLVVTGRPTAFTEIEKLLRGLDVPPVTPSAEVKIIPLLKADAKSLADVLNEMLRPSSEGQVTPEARILQEQVKRLRVSGPATGDQIPELDLTKPIKIDADPSADGSNSLIVSSTVENVKALAAIIAMMDTVPISEAVEVRIVQLTHADAASVLNVLREVFAEGAKQLAGDPDGPVAGRADPVAQPGKSLVKPLNVSADPRTNMLVLSGAPDTLALAQKVIADLDQERGGVETEVRMFKLVHADAARLADVLAAVFAEDTGDAADEGVRTFVNRLVRTKPNGEALATQFAKSRPALTIEAEESTNTLVIAARSDLMPLIADVITSMDIPGAGSMNSVRILPLEFADASRIAEIVEGLYSGANADLIRDEDKPTVETDPRTNSLIISASDKTYDTIVALVDRLDGKTPIEMRDIRLVPLQNADAGSLADTVQEMMDARVQRQESLGLTDAEALRVVVIADLRSNSLIVGGSPEGFELVKQLAEQLDGAAPALSGTIQILPLSQANAGTMSEMLSDLFDKRYDAARTPDVERQKPIILPDLRTNSLLVAANQDDSRVLADLLARLDVKPSDPAVRLVVIGLAHNDAGIVGPMIEEIFEARLEAMTAPGATAAPQDEVSVSIDALNNAMIISASRENLDLIEELLTKVDVEPGAVTGVVRMYYLENSDAERIAGLLSNLISDGLYKPGMAAADNAVQQAREKVSIVSDTRTNVLVVSASRENFAVIEEIIKKLDATDDFGALGDIRLYQLKYAEASKLAPVLLDFFKTKLSNEQSTGGSDRALEVTIIADTRTNTLLVAGSRQSFKALEAMIARLDTDGAPRGAPKVFALRKANAAAVVDTITDLYATQDGLEEAGISISADERTNAVVVSAGAADIERIERIINQLDSPKVSNVSEIRVFPLRQADATELADLLNETLTNKPVSPTSGNDNRQMLVEFIRHLPGGQRIISQALQEGVLITPDTRANALVVVAAKDAMGLLTNLIEELDSVTPPPGEIRMFRLVNADARQMADVLAELFGLDTSDATGASYTLTTDSGGSATLATGGADQASMTVTVDGRTNTLLLGGSEQLVNMASKVIQELDSAPGQERVPVVYHLRNAKATDIETAIRTWLDDERQRVADAMADDLGSGLQLLEQEVSVVAVTSTTTIGDQSSETSSTLLISASPRNIDRIVDMVAQLDEPPPQVNIGVVMVEVRLDDSTELGVDWDLDVDLNADRLLNAATFLGTVARFGASGSGLNLAVTGGDLDFFLQALHGQGRVEVLARPTITAIDNHQAEISIGKEVPFLVNSNISDSGFTSNFVDYRTVGTLLKVTPRISPDGFVLMEVEPEISSLTSSSVQFSGGTQSPIFNERKATTTVSVRDGHTIVIGGLITTEDDFRETKIPLLGDIPYLGHLFKRTVHTTNRTEFLMMLTPRIIRNPADAARVTKQEYERTHLNEGVLAPYNDILLNGAKGEQAPPPEANTRSQSVIRPTGRLQSQTDGWRSRNPNVTVIGGAQ